MRSLDERLHEAELMLAARKAQQRQSLTRQKIIVGGAVLSSALKKPVAARQLADLLRANVARGPDLKAIEPVLSRLDEIAGVGQQPETPASADLAGADESPAVVVSSATAATDRQPSADDIDIDFSKIPRRLKRRRF